MCGICTIGCGNKSVSGTIKYHLNASTFACQCIFHSHKKQVISLFCMAHQVLNTTSSHDPSSGNTVNASRQFADIISGQQTLPSWYNTSIHDVPKHGTNSHNRWQTQMAFTKTVYSFEVKENTVPG